MPELRQSSPLYSSRGVITVGGSGVPALRKSQLFALSNTSAFKITLGFALIFLCERRLTYKRRHWIEIKEEIGMQRSGR
jgi:hypothetical protein